MSQPDNDSEQVDLQASKQVYEDAGKELERKKRKFAGEYKTEKCVLCQEMITEREAYSHTKLCLDDYELVFQLGSYSPNAKEAILQSASIEPTANFHKKRKTITSVPSDDDETDVEVESPLNKKGYQENPYKSKTKKVGKPITCILNDKTLFPSSDKKKAPPLCNPTKPFNNKENVMLCIGEKTLKVCRISHIIDKSMKKKLAAHLASLDQESKQQYDAVQADDDNTCEASKCEAHATGYYSVGPRDCPKPHHKKFCCLNCMWSHLKLMKSSEWKEFMKEVKGCENESSDDEITSAASQRK